MRSFVSLKVARVLVAVSVSLWMTGAGCMLGCGNHTLGASASIENQSGSPETVVAAASCHTQAHDCCAKKTKRKETVLPDQTSSLSAVTFTTEGMMHECPLTVNANAAVTKVNSDAPSANQVVVVHLPRVDKKVHLTNVRFTPVQSLNRGPTYLRFCAFLI